MRAAYAAKLGGDAPLENLVVGERPAPEPKRGEVRIRVRAVSLNHHDYFTLRGIVGYPIAPPRILGCEAAGVVEAYGPERPADSPEPGEAVVVYPVRTCGRCRACMGSDPMLCGTFTMLSDGDREGSMAEYVVVPALHAIPKPAQLTFEEAACVGVTFLTAYRMLFVKARATPGETVLVQGAGGGLGTAAVQLGAAAGLRVIASSRSEKKREAARALGASHTVEPGRDAAKQIVALTNGDGVDAVLESVGEPTWPTSLRAVRQGGAVVVAGATAGPNPPADLARIFWRQIRVLGSTMGSYDEFVSMLRLMESAEIKPLIDRVYPLPAAREAMQALAEDKQIGKLVITV